MWNLGIGDGLRDAALLSGFALVVMFIFLAERKFARGHAFSQGLKSGDPRGRYRFVRFQHDRRRDLHTAEQLRIVMAATFEKKQLLNYSERRVFRTIQKEVIAMNCGYRVFAQVSLGEILQASNRHAFYAINDKRTDILVVDANGWPALAVEHQGGGHYQGTAVARDTLKRAALQNAGIGYLEVLEADSEGEIRRRLRQCLAGMTERPRPR